MASNADGTLTITRGLARNGRIAGRMSEDTKATCSTEDAEEPATVAADAAVPRARRRPE